MRSIKCNKCITIDCNHLFIAQIRVHSCQFVFNNSLILKFVINSIGIQMALFWLRLYFIRFVRFEFSTPTYHYRAIND